MAIDEYSRHQLHTRLTQVLGADDAATLMASLPAIAWGDLATKEDLAGLEALVLSELRGQVSELRTEMSAELRVQVAELRVQVAELRREIGTQSRTLILSLVGLQISAAGLVVAVSHFV